MFSRSILCEKNPKYQSGGRKSTYCDANDSHPAAQHVKSGLNPLPLLLRYDKYIHEVGKLSGRFFPAGFWAKHSEIWIWGTKVDILWCNRLHTYSSTSQIGFKSSLISSNISEIQKSSRKSIETMFFRSILGKKSEMWIWGTKIDILGYDRFPTYRSRSQIGFKSSPIASNRSQIHTWSRKTITNVFSRSILCEKNPKYGSARRKSTYCDATDF